MVENSEEAKKKNAIFDQQKEEELDPESYFDNENQQVNKQKSSHSHINNTRMNTFFTAGINLGSAQKIVFKCINHLMNPKFQIIFPNPSFHYEKAIG